MQTLGYVHSIETFGTVDGPGTRFIVFLQGCLMKCQYCHNPDTWQSNIGNQKSVSEIIDMFEQYRPFLKDGGITVSGGEPMLQIDFVTELFEEAKRRGVHTCLDTCGATFNDKNEKQVEKVHRLLESTDLVMLDIKHINDEAHKVLTGVSNDRVLRFASFLDENGTAIRIRHVVVPTITLNNKYLYQLGYFLGKFKHIESLEVLPYHLMGIAKWEEIGREYPLTGIPEATAEEAQHARLVILKGMQDYRAANPKEQN